MTTTEAARYPAGVEMARADILAAWSHADTTASGIGHPRRYLVFGDGSGAAIAGDITLGDSEVPYEIAGLMLTSGAPHANRAVTVRTAFPVVIHGGLLDSIAPAYSAPVFFDADMPVATGLIDLYLQVAASGAPVRLYMRAQEGRLNGSADRIADYAAGISLFLGGSPTGVPAAIEYRFICDDPVFGAAGPGRRINTAQFPGFRYEPYQSDLESGLSPATTLALHPMALGNCEG